MALVVEDNTGLATAESYVSVADWRAWALARAIDTSDLTDADAEGKLRLAFDYVNTFGRYTSTPLSNDQAGEFPRVNLSDRAGRIFNTVPKRVKDAQCEAAVSAMSGTLLQVLDRGGRIKSEAIGPISTTYADDAPAGRLIEAVDRLLAPFLKGGEPLTMVPSFYDNEDPQFDIGMHDNVAADYGGSDG